MIILISLLIFICYQQCPVVEFINLLNHTGLLSGSLRVKRELNLKKTVNPVYRYS